MTSRLPRVIVRSGGTGERVWERLGDRIVGFVLGYDVFVSYARQDGSDYAKRLASELQQRGYACYFDTWASSPERMLPARVIATARRASMLVVVGTRAAATNRNVEAEVLAFVRANAGRNRSMIVIHLDPAIAEVSWEADMRRVSVPDWQGAEGPAPEVLAQIDAAAGFTKRARRLQRTALGVGFGVVAVVLATLVGIGYVLRDAHEEVGKANEELRATREETERARAETERAREAQKLAEHRENDAKRNAVDAQRQASKAAEELRATREDAERMDEARRRAEAGLQTTRDTAESLTRANVARAILSSDPDEALRRATAAVRLSQTPEAVTALREILQNHVRHRRFGTVKYSSDPACITGDGSVVYTRGEGPHYPLLQWDARGEGVRTLTCGTRSFHGVVCNPRQRHAVAGFEGRLVVLEDFGAPAQVIPMPNGAVYTEYDSEGEGFMSVDSGTVRVWALSGSIIGERSFDQAWGRPALLPSLQAIIALGHDGKLRHMDMHTGKASVSAATVDGPAQLRRPLQGEQIVIAKTKTWRDCEIWDVEPLARREQRACYAIIETDYDYAEPGRLLLRGRFFETDASDHAFFPGSLGARQFLAETRHGLSLWDTNFEESARITLPHLGLPVQPTTVGSFATGPFEKRGFEVWSPEQPVQAFELRTPFDAVLGPTGTRALVVNYLPGEFVPAGAVEVVYWNEGVSTSVWPKTKLPDGWMTEFAASPRGRYFAFIVNHDELHVVDVDEPHGTRVLAKDVRGACLVINDRGDVAFISHEDGSVQIVRHDAEHAQRLRATGCPIRFSPSSERLFISDRGEAWVQALEDRTVKAIPIEGSRIGLSEDGRRAATIDEVSRLRVWQLATNWASAVLLRSFETFLPFDPIKTKIALDDRGHYALITTLLGIHVWDLEQGGQVMAIHGNDSTKIRAARFVSGSTDIAYVGGTHLVIERCLGCQSPERLVALAEERLRPPRVIDLGAVDVCSSP